jgi:hypothetical protein
MDEKHEKRLDLLDLPVAERKRLCFEIRAALRDRVVSGKIPVSDDTIIADKSMRDSLQAKSCDEGKRDSLRRSTVKFASALKKA